MKLEKITIHNIASIADAVIDFTTVPLKDTPLFLIDGETGAGKTTILDSICLALYATTPRISESNKEEVNIAVGSNNDVANINSTLKLKDARQLIRRGCSEAFAELHFTGNDDNEYVAKWAAHYSRNGKLQPAKHTLENIDTKDVRERENQIASKIDEVVGLNFNQFCRTTMLAQGDFTKFLYSKEDEKASILEKLTGTERYAKIGTMINTIYGEVKKQYDEKSLQLGMIECLTVEELSNLKQELTESEAAKTKVSAEVDSLTKLQTWLKDYSEKSSSLTDKQSELAKVTAETETAGYKEEEKIIADYNATTDVRNNVNERNKASDNLQRENARVSDFGLKYQALLAGTESIKKEIALYKEQETKLAEDVDNATKAVEAAKNKTSAQQEKIDGLIQSRNALKPQQLKSDLDMLEKQMSLCKDARSAYNELLTTQQADKDANDELKSQEDSLTKQKGELTKQTVNRDQCRSNYEAKRKQYDIISQGVKDWAREARRKLVVGEICPVCGQKVVSIAHDDMFVSLLEGPEREMNTAKQAYDDASATVKGTESTIRELQKSLKQLKDKANRTSSRVLAKRKSLLDICSKIEGFKFEASGELLPDFPSLLDAKNNSLAEKRQRLKAKQTEVDNLSAQIEAENKTLTALQNDYHKVENDKNIKETRQRDNHNAIDKLTATLNNCETMKSSVSAMAANWPAGDKTTKPIPEDKLQAKWNALAQDAAAWQNSVALYRKTIDECQSAIDAFLSANKLFTKEYLERLSKMSANDITRKSNYHKEKEKAIANANGAISTLTAQINELQKTKPADADKHTLAELDSEIREKNGKKEELTNNISTINVKIKQDKLNRDKRAKMEKEVEKLKTDYNRWDKLNKILGSSDGKRFKMIAQSFILGHLLRLANKYLEQFTDRFTLTCRPGSLVILINDHYQGDIPYGANTLSGGESFLVSLSLALGLSQLNATRNSVDTMFIDEGFGTLDGDYLNAVMDALSKLHTIAGRRVGIISHVEILSTIIPTQIAVKKENPTQSKVIVRRING